MIPQWTHETIFDKIWKEATASNAAITTKNKLSVRWLSKEAAKFNRATDNDLAQGWDKHSRSVIGQMYFFHYFPKGFATLPYYDIFPLVFPVSIYKDGFLGINLHYLPPYGRLKLMNALIQATNAGPDKRIPLTYGILKSISTTKTYEPCIKRYLTTHYRSNFIQIHRKDWQIALFLPLAKFQKKSQERVWRLSSQQVRGMNHAL